MPHDPAVKIIDYEEFGVKVNWRGKEMIIPYPLNVVMNRAGRYVFEPIPESMKRLAYMTAYDIRTSKAGGNDRTKSKYQFFNDLKGQIGNLVASHVLLGNEAHAVEEITIGGKDYCDLQYKGLKIDVKTSEYMGLHLSANQFANDSKCDYYIAVKVNKEDDKIKEQIENNWRDTTKMLDDLLPQVFKKALVLGYLPTSKAPELIEKGSYWHKVAIDNLWPITKLENELRESKFTRQSDT